MYLVVRKIYDIPEWGFFKDIFKAEKFYQELKETAVEDGYGSPARIKIIEIKEGDLFDFLESDESHEINRETIKECDNHFGEWSEWEY